MDVGGDLGGDVAAAQLAQCGLDGGGQRGFALGIDGGAAVDAEGKPPLPAAIESALRELGCGHISPEVTPYIHGNMNL